MIDRKMDSSPKKRINISITEETYQLLKNQANRNNTTMSEMILGWIWDEEELAGQVRINRAWVKDIDVATLERLLVYCSQKHCVSPAQAVTDLIWKAKVDDKNIPGQLSFRK